MLGNQPELPSQARALLTSARFQSAKQELLATIFEASQKITDIRAPSGSDSGTQTYAKMIGEFQAERGRDLYFQYLSSGLGSGPFVELCDGSVKFDMVTGIGINFFGHSHPELMSEVIDGISSDPMQGNLQPGYEAKSLIHAVVSRVGPESRIKHGWLMCSGTMCNEIALKIIRQKRFPATKILAFKDCFAGRSTAMQEITDNPGYRQGQPIYGEVAYLSFYDPSLGLEKSVARTLSEMKEHLTRFPDRFAALMIELIQGEGGFNYAPREFYVRVFDEAKKANLAIWADEIQTFGRSGELFAFQKFGLSAYIDVVTIGKMLQACMVLYTADYNPKAGLVAGTFSGSAVALRTGRRVMEMLTEEGFLGPEGKIEKLSTRFVKNLRALEAGTCKGSLGEIRAIGGMIAFAPHDGTMEQVKTTLMKLFELGVVAFYCGHGPYLLRLLPPLGAMNESHVDQVCSLIERAILETRKK